MSDKIDIGKYNKNPAEYEKIISNIYEMYPEGVSLDAEYADWIQSNLNRFLIRLSRYKFASKMLSQADNVLEIGCGSGLGSMFLSQFSSKVTGIDIKKNEIDAAIKLNKRENCQFKIQDFFEWNEENFDSIVALDVIEHFNEIDGEVLLQKCAEKAKKSNGMVIIGTPSIYSFPYQSPISQASHIKCYDLDELKQLVGKYFSRVMAFGMNDELVHTGNAKMSWYYFVIGVNPCQS